MRFSLVLSTKNRVQEVDCFLESLSNQTCQDFELILVDQNSDDRLADIIESYSRQFPIHHIKYLERGLSRARNQGLQHITGELFGFPDDDCIYPPECLAQISEFFQQRDRDGLVINILDLEEDKEAMLFSPETAGVVDYDKGWIVGMTAALFFRSYLAGIVKFDEEMGPATPWGGAEDVDYLYRCLDAEAKTYYEPNIIIRHPTPTKIYSVWQSVTREFNHARGAGFLMGKCQFSYQKVFWETVSPLIFTPLFIFKGRGREAVCFPGVSLGRAIGYLGSLKVHQNSLLPSQSSGVQP